MRLKDTEQHGEHVGQYDSQFSAALVVLHPREYQGAMRWLKMKWRSCAELEAAARKG